MLSPGMPRPVVFLGHPLIPKCAFSDNTGPQQRTTQREFGAFSGSVVKSMA